MFKKRTFVMILVLLMCLSFVSYTYADGKYKKELDSKLYEKAHLILTNEEELGLSDAQVEKIKELKITTKKDIITKDASIDIIAVDIKAEMWKDPVNVDKINKLIDKKYDIKKEKTKTIVKACADIKDVLTKDQKAKLKGICKKEKMAKKMNCPMMSGKMMSGKKKQ